MLKKKILITGGTGFLGFHLAKQCIKNKWCVTSVSTKKPKNLRRIKGVKYILCNTGNLKQVKKKIKKDFNYVVNLAGYVDHKNKIKTYNSHYIGCKNIAFHFVNTNVSKFIQIGSSIEYGKLNSPQTEKLYSTKTYSTYGYSKLLSSNFLINLNKLKKFPACILRFYLVYGPYQDQNRLIPIVINNCLKNKSFNCSSGEQKRDFLFVDDAISAIISALKSKKSSGNIFNIGLGSGGIKVKTVINYINNKIGKGKPKFGKIKFRKDEIKNLYPNISKAKKILKWKPKINFREGIIRTINFYKKK